MRLSYFEKNVLRMLCRLFWLITDLPGCARHPGDVKLFVEVEMEIGDTKRDTGNALIRAHYKAEGKEPPKLFVKTSKVSYSTNTPVPSEVQ